MKIKTSFRVFFLKQHRKNSLKNIFFPSESVFLDFSFWPQGHRSTQNAHCALQKNLRVWNAFGIKRVITFFHKNLAAKHKPSRDLFFTVLGHSHFRGISTLNFGPFSTKLGGTVRAIKKMTQNVNGPGLGRNYEKQLFLRSAEKCFFGQKWVLTQKITQNFLRDWYLFGKRQLFSLNNFFLLWPRLEKFVQRVKLPLPK